MSPPSPSLLLPLPSSSLVAVLDACVLVPAALCDFLLRAASAGLYHLRWTDEILDEVRRTLVADLGRPHAQADRRIAAMKQAFPNALVAPTRQIIGAMPNEVDAKNQHVVAAAVVAHAPVIVTSNLRDFPAPALAPLGIEALSPDDFLQQLYALDVEAVRVVLHRQAAALVHPPLTPLDVVAALRRDAPTFSSLREQDLRT
jgi:PIN domain